jgi:hypothetical protein
VLLAGIEPGTSSPTSAKPYGRHPLSRASGSLFSFLTLNLVPLFYSGSNVCNKAIKCAPSPPPASLDLSFPPGVKLKDKRIVADRIWKIKCLVAMCHDFSFVFFYTIHYRKRQDLYLVRLGHWAGWRFSKELVVFKVTVRRGNFCLPP